MALQTTAWKDVPRRLLTIGVGVPWIAFQMRYYVTSWLFFQVSHVICLFEWRNLVPPPPADCKKSDDHPRTTPIHNDAKPETQNMKQKLLSVLFDEQWQSLSDLERCQFYAFSFFSLVLTILPTSLIPMTLMFASIILRMIQFIPSLQSPTLQSVHTLHGVQHYQFGLVYISLGFHYMLQIRQKGGPRDIGCLLFVVWMSDTGALIFGRLMKTNNKESTHQKSQHGAFLSFLKSITPGKTIFGRLMKESTHQKSQHRVFLSFLKSISPGKTIPGLIGAVITGPISAILYPIDLSTNTKIFSNPLLQKICLGLALSVVGIIGDLAESSVKRMSGKKDSGGLLPGHGGVVDRFDSLFTAGIVYYYWVLA